MRCYGSWESVVVSTVAYCLTVTVYGEGADYTGLLHTPLASEFTSSFETRIVLV
jgi:hypothetical protein